MSVSSLEPLRAIACKACGKILKIRSMPVDASDRIAVTFRMTCLKCNNSGNYTVHDVFVVGGRRT